MACSKCRRKAAVISSAPAYSTTQPLACEDCVSIAANSSLLIKSPMKEQYLKVGSMAKVSRAAALDLISKGAPVWIFSN